ncbi:Hypothetical predicted protein, partial [Olea europaea subsp. europaea]
MLAYGGKSYGPRGTVRQNQKGRTRSPPSKNKAPCSKCGRTNHTVDTCWEIHGYSPNHKLHKPPSSSKDYRAINLMETENDSRSPSTLSVSQEQIQQLIALLQSQKSSTTNFNIELIGNHLSNTP